MALYSRPAIAKVRPTPGWPDHYEIYGLFRRS
jgi:hypothetical protein